MSHPDLQGADDELVAYADTAAAELRQKFENEPEAECVAWLEIALEREAMVGEAYDDEHLDKHLDRLRKLGVDPAVVELLRKTIGHVWAQEESHTVFIRSMLKVIKKNADDFLERIRRNVLEISGVLEGQITSRLTSPSLIDRALAIAAVSVGRRIASVPPFIDSLRATEFPPFCAVNAALEQTAIAGYQRLSELCRKLRNDELLSGTDLDIDLDMILLQEKYHEAVFRGFSGWQVGNASPNSPRDPSSPLDPSPFTVMAHSAVVQHARASVYGAGAPESRATEKMIVDVDKLRRDPLTQYLHTYAQTFGQAPQSIESRQKAREARGEPAEI
jgi:hypothetical protein